MATPVRPELLPFGRFVATQRVVRGFSTKALGQEIGCDPSAITYWQQGRNEPGDDLLVGLARALDVAVFCIANLLPRYAEVDGSTVGSRMQIARWALGLTAIELAEQLDVPVSSLRSWETGAVPFPGHRIDAFEAILGPLNVPDPIPTAPDAGVVKWIGKKTANLLPYIPAGATYVEPYGGSGSILLAREPSGVEVYNDLHGDLTNLFRVLQDEDRAHKLHHRLSLTLYSRAEYQRAMRVLARSKSSDDRAWAFFVLINQSFEGKELRTDSNWAPATKKSHLHTWWGRVAWAGSWHERLATVIIENQDALSVIRRYDSPDTVHYLDPPYVRTTRNNAGKLYRHEMTQAHHADLVDTVLGVDGAVVLSGYPNATYDPLETAGWERIELVKKGRAESVWRNPRALELAA